MTGLVPVKDERTSTGTHDGVGTGAAAGKQEMELSAKAALQQEECKRG